MDKPTLRQLLDTNAVPGDEPWSELAGRVENVVSYCAANLSLGRGSAVNLRAVLALLDGKYERGETK